MKKIVSIVNEETKNTLGRFSSSSLSTSSTVSSSHSHIETLFSEIQKTSYITKKLECFLGHPSTESISIDDKEDLLTLFIPSTWKNRTENKTLPDAILHFFNLVNKVLDKKSTYQEKTEKIRVASLVHTILNQHSKQENTIQSFQDFLAHDNTLSATLSIYLKRKAFLNSNCTPNTYSFKDFKTLLDEQGIQWNLFGNFSPEEQERIWKHEDTLIKDTNLGPIHPNTLTLEQNIGYSNYVISYRNKEHRQFNFTSHLLSKDYYNFKFSEIENIYQSAKTNAELDTETEDNLLDYLSNWNSITPFFRNMLCEALKEYSTHKPDNEFTTVLYRLLSQTGQTDSALSLSYKKDSIEQKLFLFLNRQDDFTELEKELLESYFSDKLVTFLFALKISDWNLENYRPFLEFIADLPKLKDSITLAENILTEDTSSNSQNLALFQKIGAQNGESLFKKINTFFLSFLSKDDNDQEIVALSKALFKEKPIHQSKVKRTLSLHAVRSLLQFPIRDELLRSIFTQISQDPQTSNEKTRSIVEIIYHLDKSRLSITPAALENCIRPKEIKGSDLLKILQKENVINEKNRIKRLQNKEILSNLFDKPEYVKNFSKDTIQFIVPNIYSLLKKIEKTIAYVPITKTILENEFPSLYKQLK